MVSLIQKKITVTIKHKSTKQKENVIACCIIIFGNEVNIVLLVD